MSEENLKLYQLAKSTKNCFCSNCAHPIYIGDFCLIAIGYNRYAEGHWKEILHFCSKDCLFAFALEGRLEKVEDFKDWDYGWDLFEGKNESKTDHEN
jgi:hypothetical protein